MLKNLQKLHQIILKTKNTHKKSIIFTQLRQNFVQFSSLKSPQFQSKKTWGKQKNEQQSSQNLKQSSEPRKEKTFYIKKDFKELQQLIEKYQNSKDLKYKDIYQQKFKDKLMLIYIEKKKLFTKKQNINSQINQKIKKLYNFYAPKETFSYYENDFIMGFNQQIESIVKNSWNNIIEDTNNTFSNDKFKTFVQLIKQMHLFELFLESKLIESYLISNDQTQETLYTMAMKYTDQIDPLQYITTLRIYQIYQLYCIKTNEQQKSEELEEIISSLTNLIIEKSDKIPLDAILSIQLNSDKISEYLLSNSKNNQKIVKKQQFLNFLQQKLESKEIQVTQQNQLQFARIYVKILKIEDRSYTALKFLIKNPLLDLINSNKLEIETISLLFWTYGFGSNQKITQLSNIEIKNNNLKQSNQGIYFSQQDFQQIFSNLSKFYENEDILKDQQQIQFYIQQLQTIYFSIYDLQLKQNQYDLIDNKQSTGLQQFTLKLFNKLDQTNPSDLTIKSIIQILENLSNIRKNRSLRYLDYQLVYKLVEFAIENQQRLFQASSIKLVKSFSLLFQKLQNDQNLDPNSEYNILHLQGKLLSMIRNKIKQLDPIFSISVLKCLIPLQQHWENMDKEKGDIQFDDAQIKLNILDIEEQIHKISQNIINSNNKINQYNWLNLLASIQNTEAKQLSELKKECENQIQNQQFNINIDQFLSILEQIKYYPGQLDFKTPLYDYLVRYLEQNLQKFKNSDFIKVITLLKLNRIEIFENENIIQIINMKSQFIIKSLFEHFLNPDRLPNTVRYISLFNSLRIHALLNQENLQLVYENIVKLVREINQSKLVVDNEIIVQLLRIYLGLAKYKQIDSQTQQQIEQIMTQSRIEEQKIVTLLPYLDGLIIQQSSNEAHIIQVLKQIETLLSLEKQIGTSLNFLLYKSLTFMNLEYPNIDLQQFPVLLLIKENFQTKHSEIKKKVAQQGSQFEKQIENNLKSLKINYKTSQLIGPYVIDFLIDDKIILECHGRFHYIGGAMEETQISLRKTRILEKMGYKLVVISYAEWDKIQKFESRYAFIKNKIYGDQQQQQQYQEEEEEQLK